MARPAAPSGRRSGCPPRPPPAASFTSAQTAFMRSSGCEKRQPLGGAMGAGDRQQRRRGPELRFPGPWEASKQQRPGIGVERSGKQLLRQANLRPLRQRYAAGIRSDSQRTTCRSWLMNTWAALRVRLSSCSSCNARGFHRFIQRRHSLIRDHQPRLHRQRAYDIHPPPLAAGDAHAGSGYRQSARRLQTNVRQQIAGIFAALLALTPWTRWPKAMLSSMVRRGLSGA